MVDGQVNNLKSAEGKRVERKPVQRPEQSSKKKPKKRESVIKRLREKQIAIAVKSQTIFEDIWSRIWKGGEDRCYETVKV